MERLDLPIRGLGGTEVVIEQETSACRDGMVPQGDKIFGGIIKIRGYSNFGIGRQRAIEKGG